MKKILTFLLFCFLLTTLANAQEKAAGNRIPGQLIVQLQPGVAFDAFQQIWKQSAPDQALRLLQQLGIRSNTFLLSYQTDKTDDEALLSRVRAINQVVAAQFNYEVEYRALPNDPDYPEQWGLEMIQAPEAWDFTTGGVTARGDTIVIAIIESSFDPDHEDLRDNLWYNRDEIRGDGIDNDNNGYVDDFMGWDFIDSTPVHTPTSFHGTATAGILGAKGNNGIGVTGVNWNVKLMLLRATRVDQIVEAYEYMLEQRDRYNRSNGAEGAFVAATNSSFGLSRTFCEEQPVWGGMFDLIGAVGILTGAGTDNSAYDVEELGDMPTSCPSDFLITVTNTTPDDEKYQVAAWGTTSIDMGAPGQGSFSSWPGDSYGPYSGNSAAAPHLTGTIALLYSLPCPRLAEQALTNPASTALVVREAILAGVDRIEALQEYTVTSGRLNVFNSLEILQGYCDTAPGKLTIYNLSPNPTLLDWLEIEYETPESRAYDFEIYNTLGQLLQKVRTPVTLFNRNRYILDVSRLKSGAYFLVLRDGVEVETRKFIVHGQGE